MPRLDTNKKSILVNELYLTDLPETSTLVITCSPISVQMGLFLPLGHQNLLQVICLDLTNNKAIPIDGKLYHISLKNNIELRRKVVDGQMRPTKYFQNSMPAPTEAISASGPEWGWTSING